MTPMAVARKQASTKRKKAPNEKTVRTASAGPQPSSDPLCIYVAWHPRCEDARALARHVFRWFRGNPFDIEECATGIPVSFREWHDGSAREAPLDLPTDGEGIKILVPLVDEHFATSKAWRHYVHRHVRLARESGNIIVFPVALHPGAFQLAGDVATLNFLRPDGAQVPGDETAAERQERRAVRLRTQLTEALGRLLRARNHGFHVDQFDEPPEKVSVFLSHAKSDGAEKAASLRDEIQRRGQLQAFYDENDLAYGFDYRRELTRALTENNAVLLAVLSDSYSSRPWCRYELRTMRRVHVERAAGPGGAGICKLAPVVVVDALEGQSQDHLPELGPAPVIRWQVDRVGLIVDTVLRQVLQYAHALKRATFVAQRLPRRSRASTWLINGPPDLGVVAEIRLQAMAAKQDAVTLMFPGPGVTQDTLDDWHRLVPEVTCRSFEDVEVQS